MKNTKAKPKSTSVKTIHVDVPIELHRKMNRLLKAGWFPSQDAIIKDALSRFLTYHTPELMEKFIMEDVEWGLRRGK